VHVLIDSSTENTKCITTAVPVVCADDAGHLGIRINSHQAGDTFEITSDGTEVCATRTDSSGGWGMHLEIACVSTGTGITPPTEEQALSYIGCFVDDGSRDLQEGPRVYGHTSVTCNEACSDYSFFSLQNNGWCACGNAYSREPRYSHVPDGQCGGNCANDDQLCGAAWRNAVYSTGLPQPVEFRPYSYIGCFIDDGSRDLQDGPMQYGYTSVTCHDECSAYSFFALQNNGWCVCGNAYSTATQYSQVDDGQCGNVCLDDDQLCGSGWRNAVYSTGVPPPVQVEHPFSYVGCFVDDGSRDLQEGPRVYGYTSVTCNEACSDYSFFSLQHNGWCACGNAYATEPRYYEVPDGECGGNCANDDQLCGAGWRNAVYSTGLPQPVELQPYSYIGCFVDDGSRDLQEGPMQYGYTSVTCNQACDDYDFFALQNNGWCVCGNAYNTESQYGQVDNAQCGGNCANDDQLCGAGWRNAIYSTR